MAFRAKYYAALKSKLLAWHEQCPEDNLDELQTLFSDFAKKKIAPAMLFKVLGIQREVLEHAPRPDGHAISFEQVSKLFVTGVQQTDTIEELEAVLDRHIARIAEERHGGLAAPAQSHIGHVGREEGHDGRHPEHTLPPALSEQRAESISREAVSSVEQFEERRTESREEAAKRRAVERQQEWCRYSLLVASGLDGDNVGNASVRAICSNLAQDSDFVRRSTLDEMEGQVNLRLRLDADSEEKLLASVLELLFVRDKHTRRRAMSVLGEIAPRGDSRVIEILCPTRGVCLGLSDEDDVVRAHAARTLGTVATRGDEAVISALLRRVKPGTSADISLDEDQCPDVRYQAIIALGNLAQAGDERVQEAMLGLLQRPRLRRSARSMLRTKDFEDMDPEERVCASLALEALQDMGGSHAHAGDLDSLIRYRAIRTLEKVAKPAAGRDSSVRAGGEGAESAEDALGAVEGALLRAMDSHEDDSLVFFAAFSALCTRLGAVASARCLYTEGPLVKSTTRGTERHASEGNGNALQVGDTASLESLEFQVLELEASGGGGEEQGIGEKESLAFAVEVLQAWVDRHQAKKEMRAAPLHGTYGGVAKERLLDLKMRVGSLQTQRV